MQRHESNWNGSYGKVMKCDGRGESSIKLDRQTDHGRSNIPY